MRWRSSCSAFAAVAALLLLTGCGLGAAREQREERDPLLRRAQAKKNAQDIPGAVEAYLYALEKRPRLARGHLELAWIYDHDLEDYVRAAYHYQRYLELRPDAKERELVQDLLQQARLSYAVSLPEQPNGAIRRIKMLQDENASLRAEIARLSAAMARPAPASSLQPAPAAPTPAQAAATSPPPSPAPSAGATTYVVQPGDTLSRIAGRVYGDSKKWQVIYDANRAALAGGPQSVRVGQTLIIPRQESR